MPKIVICAKGEAISRLIVNLLQRKVIVKTNIFSKPGEMKRNTLCPHLALLHVHSANQLASELGEKAAVDRCSANQSRVSLNALSAKEP